MNTRLTTRKYPPTLPGGGSSIEEGSHGNILTDVEEEAARFVEELIYGGWHVPRPIHRRQQVQQRATPVPLKQIVKKPLPPARDEDDENESDPDEEKLIEIMLIKWKRSGVVFCNEKDEDLIIEPECLNSQVDQSTDNSGTVKRNLNERKVDKTARVPEVQKCRGNVRKDKFPCTLYTWTFSQRYTLFRHTQNVHGAAKKGPKSFVCKVCGVVIKHAYDLKRHHQAKHGTGKASVCPNCGKTFPIQKYMKEHQKRSCRM